MTYRELYNRRLACGWLMMLGMPVVIILCLVGGGMVAGYAGERAGGIAAFALGTIYIGTIWAVSRWPSNIVKCPYCQRKRVYLRLRWGFRDRLSSSVRISDELKTFPCCGGDLDAEIDGAA